MAKLGNDRNLTFNLIRVMSYKYICVVRAKFELN